MNTKPNESKSVNSDQEDSISMSGDLDNISDAYNDKLKRELELTLGDLTRIRKEYEELTKENLGRFWAGVMLGLELKRVVSKAQDSAKNLEQKVVKLEKLKSELMIKNKQNEKEISDLSKRRKAAKAEVLSLNNKLQKLTNKGNRTQTDISQENVSVPVFEEAKIPEVKEDPVFEKAFAKSSRLLKKLK